MGRSVFFNRDYRQILKQELDARIGNNKAYSMRAFARQLGASASFVSEVIAGKRGLSYGRATEIAKVLKFDPLKSEYFSTLVQIEKTRSLKRRTELETKLSNLENHRPVEQIPTAIFTMISEWYHFAIFELAATTKKPMTVAVASKRLKIPPETAKVAIDRLVRLEMLRPNTDGTYSRKESNILVNSVMPSEALRSFHKQMLEKAIASLQTQTPTEKFIGSQTIAFSKDTLKEASEIIEDCFRRVLALSDATKSKPDVYHLGIQLFRLTEA